MVLEIAVKGLIKQTGEKDIENIIYEKLQNITIIDNIFDNFKWNIHEIFDELFLDKNNGKCWEWFECIVYYYLGQDILDHVRMKYDENDRYFYEKCINLHRKNVSVKVLDGNNDYAIRLTAAIVELSVLDSFKTPHEKMVCLQLTYDMIFAELKTAIINLITKYSDKENDIPIVNNCDLLPVLAVIIIRSKLRHFYSNLFFIKQFSNNYDTKTLGIFEEAAQYIENININSLNNSTRNELEVSDYIKMTSPDYKLSTKQNLTDEEQIRTLQLILSSTSDLIE